MLSYIGMLNYIARNVKIVAAFSCSADAKSYAMMKQNDAAFTGTILFILNENDASIEYISTKKEYNEKTFEPIYNREWSSYDKTYVHDYVRWKESGPDMTNRFVSLSSYLSCKATESLIYDALVKFKSTLLKYE